VDDQYAKDGDAAGEAMIVPAEVQQAANELSYNAGKWLREELLKAGFSEEEIRVTMRKVMENIYIDGVPVRSKR
jgi:hypothetical protein